MYHNFLKLTLIIINANLIEYQSHVINIFLRIRHSLKLIGQFLHA